MKVDSCAACDCPLESERIVVTIGGKPVEVCCEDCAIKLKEATASISGRDLARVGRRGRG